MLYDYFHQLFAQVTNPPLDAIREEVVTSLQGTTGGERDLLNPVQTANHLGPQSVWAPIDLVVGIEADQLGELVVTQNRLGQHDLVAGVLVR
ncbi:hypothetical protein INQ28_28370, partial [Escherichia coli]|nr:hypothetical protein [Escherichia coli]